jgi:hypothetical protein
MPLKLQRILFLIHFRTTGMLATHFVADSLTLWQSPVTDERLYVASQYYVLLSQTRMEVIYVIGAITLIGALLIVSSLFDGGAGNLMFDGGSLCESSCLPL